MLKKTILICLLSLPLLGCADDVENLDAWNRELWSPETHASVGAGTAKQIDTDLEYIMSVDEPGMVSSADERHRRRTAIMDTWDRQWVDDYDLFWLFDQSSKLTFWPVTFK
jgi:hypothetical protein